MLELCICAAYLARLRAGAAKHPAECGPQWMKLAMRLDALTRICGRNIRDTRAILQCCARPLLLSAAQSNFNFKSVFCSWPIDGLHKH
ncbi:hypothetical protein FA95DRAFT_116190 [Auriscalpium vulgare]|uniref:Uncharacterized protein n=1 Tax=Auriscalpium vulgare TaxID=40419 RepID=A0ACB8RNB1_9AGAM|nr:hypothetical protein FA95DRAFT_116190 [Auriscalpium vulgare]